jgi:hypothetical protein
MPNKSKSPAKWFEAGKSLGWHKDDSQQTRKRAALKSRRGNYLKTARSLQALSNVTTDSETKRKSASDAAYFFMMHRRTGR